jgi:hypothetical protein
MQLEVIGADMVEVIPTGVGSADCIVREILDGIVLRRRRTDGKTIEKEER